MITFPQLFFSICMLVMLSGSILLIPLGIHMVSLACLFMKLAGFLFCAVGFLLFISLLRLFAKATHR